MKLSTLKKRKDFLSVASSGRSVATCGLVLQVKQANDSSDGVRVGYTVTKRVGGSVERNLIKRRLRCLASEVIPDLADLNCDYVVLARKRALDRTYNELRKDFIYALHKLKKNKE